MGKEQATVIFRRMPDDTVVGEIIDSDGAVVMVKNFGDISKDEINNVLEAFKQLHPDVDILPPIDVMGN